AFAHRQIEIEADARGESLARSADDVVALDFIASADATIAKDASLMINRDDRGRNIRTPLAVERARRAQIAAVPQRQTTHIVAPRQRFEFAIAERPFAFAGDGVFGQ